ncbi:MAG: YdcH family protein [Candidatus Sedimenticola sp. (ex Thyasira tokunagai)]
MLGEMHDILHEFPNLEGKINELHETNVEFAGLMDKHDKIDGEIRNLEEQGSPTTDEHMEELKYLRAGLKDQVFTLLRSLA